MPKAPSPPPPIKTQEVTAQDMATRLKGAQEGQALSTIGQDNPYGTLDYTTSIDPITGLPKYQANMKYTPEQQAIFDFLQQNQTGLGATGSNLIGANMGQYGQPIDLSAAENSLSNAAMDPMMANLDRYMKPQLEQKDAELRNQGILPTPNGGTGTYELEMDKVRNNQNLTKGGMIASFFPQAEQIAKDQLNMPVDLIAKMMGLSQPGNINQSLVNTPGAQVGATDVAGLATEAQQEAFRNYQQKVARQNALMSSIMGTGNNILKLPTGMGSSIGGDMAMGMGIV